MSVYPVIMCGGVGSRLWPLSTAEVPKQFLDLFDGVSPFQQTVLRLSKLAGAARLVVVAGAPHEAMIQRQLAEVGAEGWLILEPEPRDSAAAIAAAAAAVAAVDPEGVLAIVSADNHVPDEAAVVAAIEAASRAAASGQIVTLGLKPRTPSDAYGYILPGAGDGEAKPVAAFVEKPDVETARRYMAEGYLWNSGNFMAPARLLVSELETHAPETLAAARAALPARFDAGQTVVLSAAFRGAPKISIDYAVMEKTAHAAVLAVDFEAIDVGSWKTVWEASPKDACGNVLGPGVTGLNVNNVYVRSTDHSRVVVVGVENVAIVVHGDQILVCGLESSQLVKQVAAGMQGPR